MGLLEDRILTSRVMPIGPKIIPDTGAQLNSHSLEDSVLSVTLLCLWSKVNVLIHIIPTIIDRVHKVIVLEREGVTISPL